MKSFTDMLKSVRDLESMAKDMQGKIAAIQVTGAAGAGLVQVHLSGNGSMTGIEIDKSLAVPDELDVLSDLIVAAFNDAKSKLDAAMADQMKSITGGLPLPPGFKMPF